MIRVATLCFCGLLLAAVVTDITVAASEGGYRSTGGVVGNEAEAKGPSTVSVAGNPDDNGASASHRRLDAGDKRGDEGSDRKKKEHGEGAKTHCVLPTHSSSEETSHQSRVSIEAKARPFRLRRLSDVGDKKSDEGGDSKEKEDGEGKKKNEKGKGSESSKDSSKVSGDDNQASVKYRRLSDVGDKKSDKGGDSKEKEDGEGKKKNEKGKGSESSEDSSKVSGDDNQASVKYRRLSDVGDKKSDEGGDSKEKEDGEGEKNGKGKGVSKSLRFRRL